jgi:LysR family transcriptional activator of nhaA
VEWLNYHHLLYFYVVAREGSIAKACRKLHLAQPTISGQLRLLEESLGEKLFTRSGRNLVLTDVGRVVSRYAEEIFALGRELQDAVKGRPTRGPLRFTVGIVDVIPKNVAHRLLLPALQLPDRLRIVCREDKFEPLLAQLAVHALDLVLADSPASPAVKLRAWSHLIGESGVSFCAARPLAARLRARFPRSLDGAPMLLPTEGTTLRRSLEHWFDASRIRPVIVGEFDDSALLKVFGREGLGAFPVPTIVEAEIQRQFGVVAFGRIDEVRERYFAISMERKLEHPAIVALSEAARGRPSG